MAIGALFEAPGFTSDTYDSVLAQVGEEPPPGCLYHIAGPIEGGWRVIEIWRSEDDQRRFQAERLDPAFDRAGVQRVTPTFFPCTTRCRRRRRWRRWSRAADRRAAEWPDLPARTRGGVGTRVCYALIGLDSPAPASRSASWSGSPSEKGCGAPWARDRRADKNALRPGGRVAPAGVDGLPSRPWRPRAAHRAR
jgi:hypothetical protein